MKHFFFLIIILILSATMLQAKDVTLARNGTASATICLSEDCSPYVTLAAKELKQYLDKITGADFKICSEQEADTEVRIYLGQSPEAEAAGLDPATLKEDGSFIKAEDNNIFILGVDNTSIKRIKLFHLFYDEKQRGTLLGVYEFLEQLGVRWPAPGTANEYVPKRPNLTFAEGLQKVEPFYADRQLTEFWDFLREFPDAEEYCRDTNDIFLWGLRLKLSNRGRVLGCHTELSLKLKNLWAEHPECAALIDGKRNVRYSCWTEPKVLAIWQKAAETYFSGGTPEDAGLRDLNPYLHSSWPCPYIDPDEFMIDPMDHGSHCDGRCRCKRCNAFRSQHPCKDDTELLWKVIAEVAENVKEKFPGKYISTLVYPPKSHFPKNIALPDNLRVRVCVHGPGAIPTPNRLKADNEIIEKWAAELESKLPLWTYQCEAAFGRKLPGVPETYPRLTAEYLKNMRSSIAGMYFTQAALNQTSRNLDMYIAARLLWDPSRDIDAELTEYFEILYGPAAKPAQEFFTALEQNWVKYWQLATPDKPKSETLGLGRSNKEKQKLVWSEVYTKKEMQKLEQSMAEMEKAVASDPACRKRVDMVRQYIYNIMQSERAEVMDRDEMLQDYVISVSTLTRKPQASDWKSATTYKLTSALRRGPELEAGGEFKMLHFADNLYLQVLLEEPRLADSLSNKNHKTGDRNVWKDNDIEIFFYASQSKDFWQIIVTDQGKWSSQRVNSGNSKWTPMKEFRAEVEEHADGWKVEAVIPLKELGTGDLRFNLARSRKVKGTEELSTWSEVAKLGNWHDPECYGTLLLGDGN